MKIIIRWALFALAVMLIGWLLPGIEVNGFLSALLITFVIALINIFIRPLVNFISLPINFLTLGLFSFVINALLFMLAGYFVPGVEIDGFWWALAGSLAFSVLAGLIDSVTNNGNRA